LLNPLLSTAFTVNLSQVPNALRSSLLVYTHFFMRLSSLSQKNLLDSFTSFRSLLFNFQGPISPPPLSVTAF